MKNDKLKKVRLVQIRVSEVEGMMLDQLCNRFGCGASEMVRAALRKEHSRTFPVYIKGAKTARMIEEMKEEEELTPEQACESVGGRIENVNGVQMCVMKMSSSMVRKVPLSDTAAILKYKKP